MVLWSRILVYLDGNKEASKQTKNKIDKSTKTCKNDENPVRQNFLWL